MKTFKGDFEKFANKIASNEPFALSRNNDGEMIILNNQYINLLDKYNGEFVYDPQFKHHQFFREKLLESAQHKGDNYYVGIACRCCVGDEKHEALKALTGQDDDHLTWGNIFVNGNYNDYVSKILPIFGGDRKIVMVVNYKANFIKLPFFKNIEKVFGVGTNAWMDNYSVVKDMCDYVKSTGAKNKIFLFAAGPFSNILIHELYKIEPNNTYLDIGSTLDSMMDLGKTRGYLSGADTLTKICVW
jgi:hypothetical protein